MICAGIDIGSRTIALVLTENKKIIDTRITKTGFSPVANAKKIMEGIKADKFIATGYGRTIFENHFESNTVTEIKAAARGAFEINPDTKAILDIGGQDVKALSINESGKVTKFEMNDRCAAGTGKFLEIMADSLGFRLDDFGENALSFQKEITISNMCTVFAESEVTSLLAKGESPSDIAMGVHVSVVKRAVAMLKRVTCAKEIFFLGGVAKNKCIKLILEKNGFKVSTPKDPQIVVAYGASLIAGEI
ncbi:MAG: acyl-CoA dehydratase activase [Desulforegulaceae bacterium]|nr:acyl-CoA dehydratase activase [Desulforegulaceae bacterium]